MGLAATQARLLSLTSRLSDLEFRAQKISNAKIRLADESTQASDDYETALDKQVLKVENMSTQQFPNAYLQNITSYTTPPNSDGTTSNFRYVTDSSGKIVMSQSDFSYIQQTFGGTDPTNYFIAMNVEVNKGSTAPDWNTNSQSYKYYNAIWNAYLNYNNNNNTGLKVIPDSEASGDGGADWLSNQVRGGGLYLNEYDPNSQDPNDPNSTGAYIGVSWTSGDNTMNEQTDSTQTAMAEAKYEATMADINAKDKRFDMELKQIDTEHEAVQTEIDSLIKVRDKNIERSFKMFQA